MTDDPTLPPADPVAPADALTADAARAMAEAMRRAAVKVFATARAAIDAGDQAGADALTLKGHALLTTALRLNTRAVGLSLEAVGGDARDLVAVAGEAQRVLDRIGDVRRAPDIATALLAVGAGVAARNPSAAVSGLRDLRDAITA
ncbi:MAG: hypothetical protein AAFR52_18720 [Pseudomonadota bacterium]